MRALKIAATGMSAQQLRVETISNNLANMNTTGYNARRAEFADLHYQQMTRPGTINAAECKWTLRSWDYLSWDFKSDDSMTRFKERVTLHQYQSRNPTAVFPDAQSGDDCPHHPHPWSRGRR